MPALDAVVTPAYERMIFSQGRLHGSPHPTANPDGLRWTQPCFASITRFGQDRGIVPYDSPTYPDLPEDLQHSIRAAYLAWMPARVDYVRACLRHDSIIINGLLQVRRALHLDARALQALTHPTTPTGLGSFWSRTSPESHWAGPRNGTDVVLTGLVDPRDVDWIATFHHNMDYLQGDEETEIFLPTGCPITLTHIHAPNHPTLAWDTPLRRA